MVIPSSPQYLHFVIVVSTAIIGDSSHTLREGLLPSSVTGREPGVDVTNGAFAPYTDVRGVRMDKEVTPTRDLDDAVRPTDLPTIRRTSPTGITTTETIERR